MIRDEIRKITEKSIKSLQQEKVFPAFEIAKIPIERPEEKIHGDYAANVALTAAKDIKKNSVDAARLIKSKIENLSPKIFERIEVVPPGFINFFISKEYLRGQVGEIIKQNGKFGQLKIGKNKKINVEFISANPTGPLHVGNARGGFCGDVLSNVLSMAGYKVTREYYINNKGRQVEYLKNSLEGREPCYKNSYIDELITKGEGGEGGAVRFIVGKIKKTTEQMGIKYDKWFYESDLYAKGEANKVMALLKSKDLIREEEGAVWFKSANFGDDKDRVLIKQDDKETYFLSDIAYLRNKFQRGFESLIIFLGAEHQGYIGRLRAAAQALGYDRNRVVPIIFQLVKLIEGGREVKMSKRTGIYVTVDELIQEVGKDAARFFFLTRSAGSHLNFDLNLAKEQSEKNPVYYIQYAHARISSILKKSEIPARLRLRANSLAGGRNPKSEINPKFKIQNCKFNLLNHPSEFGLVKQLIRLPEIIEDTAEDYQVQRLPQYALDLAAVFHQFYHDCRVSSEDESLSRARLALVSAAGIVLRNTLNVMGISAPEKM